MYLHSKEYEIRYTDVDVSDNLKLSSLLSLLLESACLSADELGFGYSVLKPKNMGFVLVNWYIELFKSVKLGDSLSIRTWPLAPKKLIFLRDFELYVGEEKVGVATSRWCLVNLTDFSVLPTVSVMPPELTYNDFRSVDFNGWKIPSFESAENPDYVKYVSYSDCDRYNHVNNTKYGDFLLDVFSLEEMRGKTISSAQITYAHQCKYGEKLEFFKKDSDDGFLVEGKVNGEVRIQFKVKFA